MFIILQKNPASIHKTQWKIYRKGTPKHGEICVDDKLLKTLDDHREAKNKEQEREQPEREQERTEQAPIRRESLSRGGMIPRALSSAEPLTHEVDQFITLNIGRARGVVVNRKVLSGVKVWLPEGKSAARSKDCIKYLVTSFGGEITTNMKVCDLLGNLVCLLTSFL